MGWLAAEPLVRAVLAYLLREASDTFIEAMQKWEAKQAKEREHAGLTVLEVSPWANGPSSSTSPATGSPSTSDL